MKNKKKLLVVIGILVVVAIIAVAVVKSKSAAEEKSGNQIYVETSVVTVEDLKSTLLTKGTVNAKESAKVYSEVAGLVKEVLVENGDQVKEGQDIVLIDTDELDKRIRDARVQWEVAQLNYNNAVGETSVDSAIKSTKSAYENAMKSYEDSKVLFESGAISQSDLNATKTIFDNAYNTYMDTVSSKTSKSGNLKVLSLQVESAKNQYDDLIVMKEKAIIKAPMTGTVTKLEVKKYDMVSMGLPIIIIETVDQLEVSAYIGEYDISKVEVGMPVKITGYGVGDKEYEGEVSFVGSVAEVIQAGQTTEKSVLIKVSFNTETTFKPNFTADLEIQVAKSDQALTVPYEAILRIEKVDYVYEVVEGKAKKVKVEVGVQGDLTVEIKSEEIEAEDKIILSPSVDIEEGSEVIELGEETK